MHPQNRKMEQVRDVAQSVEYTSGGREVARSNRVIPTRLQGDPCNLFYYPSASTFIITRFSVLFASSSWSSLATVALVPDSSLFVSIWFGRYHPSFALKYAKYRPFLKTLPKKFGTNWNNCYLCRVKMYTNHIIF